MLGQLWFTKDDSHQLQPMPSMKIHFCDLCGTTIFFLLRIIEILHRHGFIYESQSASISNLFKVCQVLWFTTMYFWFLTVILKRLPKWYNQCICLLKAELIGALPGFFAHILPCRWFSFFPKPGLLEYQSWWQWQTFTCAFFQVQYLKP